MSTQVNVRVERLDDDNLMIWIGSFGHPVSMDEVKEIVTAPYNDGANVDIKHVLRNIAIALALNGTPLSNLPAIKTFVESTKFWV